MSTAIEWLLVGLAKGAIAKHICGGHLITGRQIEALGADIGSIWVTWSTL